MKLVLAALLLLAPSAYGLKLLQGPIMTNADMSLASINSVGVDLSFAKDGAVQAVWTGAPVGVLKLQISGDNVPDAASVVNWSDYSGSSINVSGPGDAAYNFPNAGYRWLRLVYTKTSGTGTINATYTSKGDY